MWILRTKSVEYSHWPVYAIQPLRLPEFYKRGLSKSLPGDGKAIEGGIRSDISADVLGVMLFAMMDGLQVQWLMEPEKVDMANVFRVFIDLLKK